MSKNDYKQPAARFYKEILTKTPGYDPQNKIIEVVLPQTAWDIIQGIAERSVKEHGGDVSDEIESIVSMFTIQGLYATQDRLTERAIEMVREQLEKREE